MMALVAFALSTSTASATKTDFENTSYEQFSEKSFEQSLSYEVVVLNYQLHGEKEFCYTKEIKKSETRKNAKSQDVGIAQFSKSNESYYTYLIDKLDPFRYMKMRYGIINQRIGKDYKKSNSKY